MWYVVFSLVGVREEEKVSHSGPKRLLLLLGRSRRGLHFRIGTHTHTHDGYGGLGKIMVLIVHYLVKV